MEKLLDGLRRKSTYLPPLLAIITFAVAANLLNPVTLTLIISGIDIAVTVMIVAAYSPHMVSSLRSDRLHRDQYLISGILTYWVFLAISRVWFILAIMIDRPKWMADFWLPTFCYFMIAFSGYYLIKAPSGYDENSGWRYVVWATILAVVIVTGALVYIHGYELVV